ncbi:universal stress protein [Bizionia myxarmorum]|uniref:Universal stress protein n=1 Tax=Bizionia myxarmorum TaxID=291186 RepID=A0A5D0RG72_9FLAO|nr:universal stress protein [Bizionia myxarmorum]TYB79514.1 universal stress protein [Bizionia myxarmorum]
MKTILYATDYSDNSKLALKYAYNMSAKMKTKLMVVHVFDYPTLLDNSSLKAEDPFPDIEGDAFKKHNLKLKVFCENVLKKDMNVLNFDIESIENKSVVNGIVKKANAMDTLLIVTGIKGMSALREIVMGSTAKHLIEKASCPVLTIPSDSVNTKIETILYASDFEEEDIGAINVLVEIAKPYNAKIKIVHVLPLKEKMGKGQKKDIENKIHDFIDYPNLELDILYSDDAFDTLRTYFGNSNADLIAMLERESEGYNSKIFHRDLVKRIESYGKIPLMSFNAKNFGIFHLN